jgi:hypothetical protein
MGQTPPIKSRCEEDVTEDNDGSDATESLFAIGQGLQELSLKLIDAPSKFEQV